MLTEKEQSLNIFPCTYEIRNGGHLWRGKNIHNPSAELFYVLSGGIVFDVNGRSFVVPKNHMMVVPAGSRYTCWKIPDVPMEYIHFYFKAEWEETEFFQQLDFGEEYALLEVPREVILQIYETTQYFSNENIPQMMCICAQSAKLLVLLAEAKTRKERLKREYGDVISYIKEHIREEITLKDLAGLRNVCTSYFSSQFKETTGVSHMHYLKKLRLWEAAERLRIKEANIKQVAAEVGFSNIYQFKHSFQAFFGVTPEKFADAFIEPAYVSVR